MSSLGPEILKWTSARGISQRKLARLAGVTPGYISYIVSGSKEPSLPVLQRIAAALGCEVVVRFEARP